MSQLINLQMLLFEKTGVFLIFRTNIFTKPEFCVNISKVKRDSLFNCCAILPGDYGLKINPIDKTVFIFVEEKNEVE